MSKIERIFISQKQEKGWVVKCIPTGVLNDFIIPNEPLCKTICFYLNKASVVMNNVLQEDIKSIIKKESSLG